MTKQIKGKVKGGQEWWILVPNINVYSFAKKPEKVTYLELFYAFAQHLFNAKDYTTPAEEEKILGLKKKALVEIDNKVSAIKYFAKEIGKQERSLIARRDNKKKIYDHTPYQRYLALCESYLNNLHSIYDFLKELDDTLDYSFIEDIEQEEWFKIEIDLRNIFHHNQSPLVSVEKNKVIFTFERLPRSPKYFTAEMKNSSGRYQVELEAQDLLHDVMESLNNWAKKYIDIIDENTTTQVITRIAKDGKTKTKDITLKKLKEHLS